MSDNMLEIESIDMNVLFGLPENVVYGIVCEEKKRIYIGHAVCLLTVLQRIKKEIDVPKWKHLKEDLENYNVAVIVLEKDIEEVIDRKAQSAFYTKIYLEKGYSIYCSTNLVKYTVHKEITSAYPHQNYMVVYLKNGQGDKLLVGVFKKSRDCTEFLTKYYPNNEVRYVQYDLDHRDVFIDYCTRKKIPIPKELK